ncbi:UDP-N-acetylglucosamine 2-epimerase (non-hydrolyzing) [Alsobacter sp. SYSU M60028]|uniref:UDP-N-acetylglucosamine 2-epimerase (non-hydrolyzing) n=1 Tax=Alsobacter ponti TaxID=2962936 RepID=A0ABT1LBW2_9HYPH|nr:UDP-N-acetylglucosamine 2-epimerase (non-hydrolyzing) [Alsobacter ponti]MCP8938423.1 UDP-N-acetylglucosamine 2-epimerase (non-hydrolyzing) [Alsobacter ponti]
MRVLTVFGTRPEAIKLAPLVKAFANKNVDHRVCVTGQHKQMLEQVLEAFEIQPDFDLAVMKDAPDLATLTATIVTRTTEVLAQFRPDYLVVQGDTTSTFAAAVAAFYQKVPVAHVEAGLRTGNPLSPWPEEMNRRLVSSVASLHFPPTSLSASNLLREGISGERIQVTGNTVVDALTFMIDRLDREPALRDKCDAILSCLAPRLRTILVTGHRRENFDGGLQNTCMALAEIARRDDVQIVFPVHLNPKVGSTAREWLGNLPNVHLIPPLEYLPFIRLMQRCEIIVTDSGGIQEEAPTLGKPVVITRDTTERPEAVSAGTARLVGTDKRTIVHELTRLLDDSDYARTFAKPRNPFGNGDAAEQIANRIINEISNGKN